MTLKRKPVAIGTSNTDIFECPASLEAAGKLMFGNTSASAVDVTIKYYDASLNATITTMIVTIAAKTAYPYPIPAALEMGDKIIALAATGAVVIADFLIDQSNPAGGLKAPTPQGAYSAGTTYATNDWVSSGGSSYVSRVDSNVGNTPASSPTQWQVFANKGSDGTPGSNGTGTANGTGGGSVADRIVTFLDTGGNNLKDSGVAISTINVAASALANDNRVLRSDGTGRGTQASGVTLDDSNNISGLGTGSFGGKVTAGADGSSALDLVTKQQLDGKLSTTGGTLTGALVLAADPASALQAATKQYVDGLLANVGKRGRVRATTTVNVTISTALNNGDTLDGISLVTGDLVLVKNQTAPEQNGVYVVGASPARSSEFDSWAEFPGSLLGIAEGSTNADTLWLCTSNDGGTLDTTAIAFTQLRVAGELLAANNLSDLANASTARGNLGIATVGNTGSAADLTGTLADARLSSNIPKLDTAKTWTGEQQFGPVQGTVTAVAASAIDCSAGNEFTKTAAGALTWTLTNVPSSGIEYEFRLLLTYTSGTQTWPAAFKWIGGTAPTLTGGKVYEIIGTTFDGGTTWRVASGEFAA